MKRNMIEITYESVFNDKFNVRGKIFYFNM